MILRLEAACNNHCRVCTGGLPPGSIVSPSRFPGAVHGHRDGSRAKTGRAIPVIRGQEPTMVPGLLALLREIGPAEIHTNARRFAYGRFTQQLAPFLRRVVLSLHGPEAALHDWFTRTPGSFDQTIAAMANLRSRSLPVTVRIPVGRHNLTELDRLPGFVQALGADRVRFVLLTPCLVDWAGAGEARTLAVSPLVAGPFLAAALRRAWEAGLETEVSGLTHGNFVGLTEPERDAVFEPPAEPRCRGESGPVLSSLHQAPAMILDSVSSSRVTDRAAPAWFHEPSGQVRAVLRTTCRNACQFCTTRIIHEEAGRSWPQDRTADFLGELLPTLVRRKRDGGRVATSPFVRFVALEPAEHPDIDILVAAAKGWSGEPVQIDSSGRRFADPEFAAHLLDCGLAKVDLALLGPTAAVHDRVAGVEGAFADMAAGIANLAGKVELAGHIVVVRDNEDFVVETLQWAKRRGIDVTHVSFAAPASRDPARYADVAVFLPDWMSRTRRRGAEGLEVLSLAVAELPTCLLPASWIAAWSRPPDRRGRLTWPEGFAYGSRIKERARCPLWRQCSLFAHCPGFFPQYLDLFGTRGLRPLS